MRVLFKDGSCRWVPDAGMGRVYAELSPEAQLRADELRMRADAAVEPWRPYLDDFVNSFGLGQTVDDDNSALSHEFGLSGMGAGQIVDNTIKIGPAVIPKDPRELAAAAVIAPMPVIAGALLGYAVTKNWKGAVAGAGIGAVGSYSLLYGWF